MVTRPSRTVTALLNGLVNMLVENLRGKREAGRGRREVGRGVGSRYYRAAPFPLSASPFPSDNPAGITLRERLPLLFCGVCAGPAQQRVGELFSELNARLVEGVDPQQLSRIRSCDLQQHHELAYVC